jgi:hypothetical protein
MVRKYFAKLISEIDTGEKARAYSYFPHAGGRFNQDYTKVLLSSSDPVLLRTVPARDLMTKEQVKVMLLTEEWAGEKTAPPSTKLDDMPLHFRDRSWASLRDVAKRYGFDTISDVLRRVEDIKDDQLAARIRLRALHFTDEHIDDFFVDAGITDAEGRTIVRP